MDASSSFWEVLMRRDVLMAMSADELDEYASIIGANVSGMESIGEKVSAIESKRERVHELTLLGALFVIPARSIRDKRFQDEVSSLGRGGDAEAAARLALGEEQWEKLVSHVTEDDGVVDIDALGMAVARILSSPELKNY